MSEGNSYEVTPTNEGFDRRRFVTEKIDRATGDLAGCIKLNSNFEDLNSQEQPIVREPNQERPLPTNTLLSLFGGARYVKDPDSVPMFSKDEIENEYPDDQKELIEARGIDIYPYTFEPNPDLGENMTPDDVVSALVIARTLSNKFTKQPVEYVDSVDLESIKISPEMKQKALGLMLEDGDNSLKKTVETVSKVPPIYISDDDVKYLVEARRDKGVDPKEAEEEIRAILFDEWENLPKGMLRDVLKTEGYDNLGDNAEKEQTMGELISEVYPSFNKYMDDVDRALELAFTDREKFIKKYVEDGTIRERINRVLSDLRKKLPRLNYKTASALGSMVFIIAACAPIVSGGTEETVPKESEVPEETVVSTEEEENSPTPTLTQTASPTPSPTPTATETPEPTPMVEGGSIEEIKELAKTDHVIWSMLELQKIVNAYDTTVEEDFSEYISKVRGDISNQGEYEEVYQALLELEDLGEMSGMSLIYTIKNSFPELALFNIPEGYNSVLEALPENIKQEMRNLKTDRDSFVSAFYDSYAIFTFNGNVELGDVPVGTIWFGGADYGQALPEDIKSAVVIGMFEKGDVIYPVGVTLNEKQKVVLTVFSNQEYDRVFSGPYEISLLPENFLEGDF